MLDTSYLLNQHHQCAWCGCLIHRDTRQPHGHRFPTLAYLVHRGEDRGYSHGACVVCKARLLAPRANVATRAGYGVVPSLAA